MRLGVLTDVHWAISPLDVSWHNPFDIEGVPTRMRAAAEAFLARNADAVIVAGDLAHRGDVPSLTDALQRLLRHWPGLVLLVKGNHDIGETIEALDRAAAETASGRVRVIDDTSIAHRGVRIAGSPLLTLDEEGGADSSIEGFAEGWEDDLVVLASHYPPLDRAPLLAAHGFRYARAPASLRYVADELGARRGPTVVISGHIHARDSYRRGPVLQFCGGALVEAPFECAVIEIEFLQEGQAVVRREALRLKDSLTARDPVFAPAVEAWRFAGGGWQLMPIADGALKPQGSSPGFAAIANEEGERQ